MDFLPNQRIVEGAEGPDGPELGDVLRELTPEDLSPSPYMRS